MGNGVEVKRLDMNAQELRQVAGCVNPSSTVNRVSN